MFTCFWKKKRSCKSKNKWACDTRFCLFICIDCPFLLRHHHSRTLTTPGSLFMCLLSSLSSATMTTGKLKISCFWIVFLFFLNIHFVLFSTMSASARWAAYSTTTTTTRKMANQWGREEGDEGDRTRETENNNRATGQQAGAAYQPRTRDAHPACRRHHQHRRRVSYFFCFSVLKCLIISFTACLTIWAVTAATSAPIPYDAPVTACRRRHWWRLRRANCKYFYFYFWSYWLFLTALTLMTVVMTARSLLTVYPTPIRSRQPSVVVDDDDNDRKIVTFFG